MVNLPQDVASFAHCLPRLPSNLVVIVVRREGANQTHTDFRVRREVVQRALQWLVTHNKYYQSLGITNLPQDVASFAHCLPRLPSNLDVIVVRREGANQTHTDFRVRREVVQRALQWLVTHNKYYQSLGITINTTALAQLPEDGTVSTLVSVTEDCSTPDTVSSASDTPATSEVQDNRISHSFVPMAVPSMTEQEAVQ